MKKILISSLLIGSVSMANASITFLGTHSGQAVGITYNSTARNVFAGKLRFRLNSNGHQFLAVCCDLDNTISGGQTYGTNNLHSNMQGGGIQLAGNIVAAVFGSATTNEDSAALQLAVWEATYDGTANLGTPDFNSGIFGASISGSLLTSAMNYYSSVSTPGNALFYQASPGNAGQSQLAPVPEPASLASLLVGAAFVVRRRKLR